MKGVSACQRCRRRKQKCDQKYPRCTNCEDSGASCLTYHSGKQTEIPRNYVSSLEKQVESLKQEVQNLQRQALAASAISPTGNDSRHVVSAISQTSDESSVRLDDLVKSVKNVAVEPSRQPRFLGQSSGLTLAKLVMAAIRVEALPSRLVDDHHLDRSSLPTQTTESSLPPLHVANHLLGVYFQYRTPHLPIIDRSQAKQRFERTYQALNTNESPDAQTDRDIFNTYMIIAIALCDVPRPSGTRLSQSEGCFRSAISRLERIMTYSKSDIEVLRLILLLAQFVSLFPWCGSLWHLSGIALRLCIDIGLHWESEELLLSLSPQEVSDRRSLWFSTYQLDRSLGITLGRPFGIIDESTRVQLPDPWALNVRSIEAGHVDLDQHAQQAHNHLFRMVKLESEIRHVLHSKSWVSTVAYPKPDYDAWIRDIRPRLQTWYASIPDPTEAHPSSIFACRAYWDSVYSNAMLLLHRPSSIPLHSSPDDLLPSFDASSKLISSIKVLQREGKIDVPWKYVHQLFMAGLGIIYGLWQSKEVRDNYSVGTSISTLQSCASTLSAFSESFAGAAGCRDVFDALSTATVDWLVSNDAEKMRQDQFNFEERINGLMQQLQNPQVPTIMDEGGADNLTNMLSSENIALGEMLSSAAQCPSLDYGDFGDLGLDFTMDNGDYCETGSF